MKLITTIACLGFITSSWSQNMDSIRTMVLDHVSHYPNQCQLAVAIVSPEAVEYLGALKSENDLMEIDNRDSIFEIGSVTKVFTSAILSHYNINKQVKLSDKINKYLSFKLPVKITFQQLSNHTSGLPRLPYDFFNHVKNQEDPYWEYPKDIFMKYVRNELELENKSGTHYVYSNMGAAFLAYCLEQIENKPYEDLIKDLILAPFKMTSTTLSNDQYTVPGHDTEGKEVPNWHWHSPFFATGALRSNVTDMAKFIRAYCNDDNQFLQQLSEPTFVVNEGLSLGLAIHLIKTEAGKLVSFHNGRTGGFTSSMIIDLESDQGIILLSNKADDGLDKLAFEIMSGLLTNPN